MTRLRSLLHRRQDGASTLELAVLAPVFFGCVGLGLFAAHIYEVKSDLQRAAQRSANYSAVRCDYRGNYAAASGCATGDHRSMTEVVQFAGDNFGRPATFTDLSGTTCDLGTHQAVLCRSFDPTTPAGPLADQRVRVVLKYRYDTPLAPFLRLVGAGDTFVNLTARGEATVE